MNSSGPGWAFDGSEWKAGCVMQYFNHHLRHHPTWSHKNERHVECIGYAILVSDGVAFLIGCSLYHYLFFIESLFVQSFCTHPSSTFSSWKSRLLQPRTWRTRSRSGYPTSKSTRKEKLEDTF